MSISKCYVKSPFNYTGGKYKYLQQIIPRIPRTNRFVDLFGGGFNVGLNVPQNEVIYNDIVTPLVGLWKYLYEHDVDEMLKYVKWTIEKEGLSPKNSQSFSRFRTRYNSSPHRHPLDLYILMCYSFNYQLRFNNKGEYNSSHGRNKSRFNENLEKRFVTSISCLQEKQCQFHNKQFNDFTGVDRQSFVYLDPPYDLTKAIYNDGRRGYCGWSQKDEILLYKYIEWLNEKDIPYGLSNIVRKGEQCNRHLMKFIEETEPTVYEVSSNYSNSNYNRKRAETVEVYVTNV